MGDVIPLQVSLGFIRKVVEQVIGGKPLSKNSLVSTSVTSSRFLLEFLSLLSLMMDCKSQAK